MFLLFCLEGGGGNFRELKQEKWKNRGKGERGHSKGER